MILKLISKIVYQANADKPEVKEEIFFYDGFDRVMVFNTSTKEMEMPIEGALVYAHTQETSDKILGMRLLKRDELLKTLYIDYGYSVYLMSDEGKTIERIN